MLENNAILTRSVLLAYFGEQTPADSGECRRRGGLQHLHSFHQWRICAVSDFLRRPTRSPCPPGPVPDGRLGDPTGAGEGAQAQGTGPVGFLDLAPVRKLRPDLALRGVSRAW